MTDAATLLARVRIVLARPKYPENIGSAARAAHNMGLGRLLVVGDPPLDLEPALKTATHNAAHLVHGIGYHQSLAQAVADAVLVVATTARQGRQRQATAVPAELAARILPALEQGPVALLFGPEDKGLANEDLAACGLVVTIPTAGFSSLNLAQAVAIVCYELHQGLARLTTTTAGPRLYRPRPANREELAAMVEAAATLCQTMDRSSGQGLAARRLRHLRQVANRGALTAREAKLLKDACRQLTTALAPGTEPIRKEEAKMAAVIADPAPLGADTP